MGGSTGNKHLDLYNLAQMKAQAKGPRRDQTSEEFEFQKSKDELKFKPKILKKAYIDTNQPAKGLKDLYGFEKFAQRLAKGREEAEFKKRMSERSSFAATTGIK